MDERKSRLGSYGHKELLYDFCANGIRFIAMKYQRFNGNDQRVASGKEVERRLSEMEIFMRFQHKRGGKKSSFIPFATIIFITKSYIKDNASVRAYICDVNNVLV